MIDKDKIAIVYTIKLKPVSPQLRKPQNKLLTHAQINTSFKLPTHAQKTTSFKLPTHA